MSRDDGRITPGPAIRGTRTASALRRAGRARKQASVEALAQSSPLLTVATRRVRIGRAYLSYRAAGAGPPLILVHGFGASGLWWRRNMQELAQHHRVYALDLIGFGASWPKGRFALAEATSHVVAWMDALGIDRADVCGHSMGGQICMHLAAAYPDRVRRLALVDACGVPLHVGLTRLAWRTARASARMRFRLAPLVARTAFQAGPVVLWSGWRALSADDVRDVASRIAAPTLIVWGEHDNIVPVAVGLVLHDAIARSRFAVIPNAGHTVMVERPAEFHRLLLDFLAGRDRGSIADRTESIAATGSV